MMRWKEFEERCIRWESTTAKTMGMIMLVFGIALLVPSVAALYFGEDEGIFLMPAVLLMITGTVLDLASGRSRHFRTVNGIVMLALAWIVMFLICAIPFHLYGMSALDSLYEAVSGFTTTGMSAMGDLGGYPTSLLVWRSLTQWIGGITIVVIFLYFLPSIGFGRGLFQNELSGSGSSSYSGRVTDAAKSFIVVYAALSAINLLLLLLAGVRPLEALCLMFTTISTGGLMILDSNMTGYSDIVQWITVFFMFMGGVNFYLHYRMIVLHERRVYRGSSEFKTMILWFAVVSAAVFLLNWFNSDAPSDADRDLYTSVKNSVFTVVSLGTTSGFYVEDFTLWPSQCTLLLMIVAVVGASSGSTSGGVKFSRLLIIYQFLKNGIGRIVNPNAVYAVKVDGQNMDDDVVQSAIVVFMLYLLTILVGAVAFMVLGCGTIDGLGLSIATVSNGGTGFEGYGPMADGVDFSPAMQVLMIALMWIGRLEIITALVFFTPGFWKELWLNSHAMRSSRRRLSRHR